MKWLLRLMVFLLSASLMIPILSGCEQQGPAEEAGEKIDEAVEETGDAIEEAGDAVQDSLN